MLSDQQADNAEAGHGRTRSIALSAAGTSIHHGTLRLPGRQSQRKDLPMPTPFDVLQQGRTQRLAADGQLISDTCRPGPCASWWSWRAWACHSGARSMVKATGIGPSNVAGVGVDELERLSIAESQVMWQCSRAGQPSYTEVILKTGAGNCDQMAHVANELIRFNGGASRVWGTSPPAHAFVVVGITPPTLGSTLDFSEAGWRGLWICDPGRPSSARQANTFASSTSNYSPGTWRTFRCYSTTTAPSVGAGPTTATG